MITYALTERPDAQLKLEAFRQQLFQASKMGDLGASSVDWSMASTTG